MAVKTGVPEHVSNRMQQFTLNQIVGITREIRDRFMPIFLAVALAFSVGLYTGVHTVPKEVIYVPTQLHIQVPSQETPRLEAYI